MSCVCSNLCGCMRENSKTEAERIHKWCFLDKTVFASQSRGCKHLSTIKNIHRAAVFYLNWSDLGANQLSACVKKHLCGFMGASEQNTNKKNYFSNSSSTFVFQKRFINCVFACLCVIVCQHVAQHLTEALIATTNPNSCVAGESTRTLRTPTLKSKQTLFFF